MNSLFDGEQGQRDASEGIEQVAYANSAFVASMRIMAYAIATQQGTVTSDDLRRYASERGMKPTHPNAWGSIFREVGWKADGMTRSKVRSNHGRMIRVWRWVGV